MKKEIDMGTFFDILLGRDGYELNNPTIKSISLPGSQEHEFAKGSSIVMNTRLPKYIRIIGSYGYGYFDTETNSIYITE